LKNAATGRICVRRRLDPFTRAAAPAKACPQDVGGRFRRTGVLPERVIIH